MDYLGSSCFEPSNVPNGGGSGGNSTNSNPDQNLNAESKVCESSFNFKTYINTTNGLGGWQVAGTSNIHMNIVDLVTGEARLLYLPTIYFGLPIARMNGDFYSSDDVKRIAADAVEYAEQAVMNYYHGLGGILNSPAMTLFYRNKINEYMDRFSGSATLTSGTNINVAQITQASYGWPIFGCL